AIHGALLTAWSAAGVAGPLIVNSVVEAGEKAGKTGPELYTPGMYIMVGALVVGFIANVLVRPVSERFFEREEDVKAKQAAALEDDN
ncbi:MAG: MFS transporter, partial [Brevibacterium aurantiacum]|nr:MFS transporter [Brevibacterium aurantiacum]